MKRVVAIISVVVLVAYMAISAIVLSRHGYLGGGATLRTEQMIYADSVIEKAIEDGEFPGAVLCVPPNGDRGLCENGGPVYRIQEGDSLEEIAALNAVSIEQLLRLNANLLPSDFVAGQVICLPTRRRAEDTSDQESNTNM